MTGRELLNHLMKLPTKTLDDFDLSVKVETEFYSLTALTLNDPDAVGILEEGTPVIISLASQINEKATLLEGERTDKWFRD